MSDMLQLVVCVAAILLSKVIVTVRHRQAEAYWTLVPRYGTDDLVATISCGVRRSFGWGSVKVQLLIHSRLQPGDQRQAMTETVSTVSRRPLLSK